MSFLSPLCALDVGSPSTRCWLEGVDKVVVTPTPASLLSLGRLTDDERAGLFFHKLFFSGDRKVLGVGRPRVIASVPCCFTSVEKQALVRATQAGGAIGAKLVSTALAAASGAGVDLTSSHAAILLFCGSQFCELAVLVSGSQVF